MKAKYLSALWLFVMLFLIVPFSNAQKTTKPVPNSKTSTSKAPTKASTTAGKEDNLNKKDAQARKQGMWFYDIPVHFGDPGYYEFGSYQDDLKTGLWYKMNKDQQLISIENFYLNELNGQAQYFDKGKLVSIGNYRGIYSPYLLDSFMVTNPYTLEDSLVIIPSEKGFTKHGNWRYYDALTGHLILEQEYQVDVLIKEKRFTQQSQSEAKPNTATPKLPHEGGKDKGWDARKTKAKKSLIK